MARTFLIGLLLDTKDDGLEIIEVDAIRRIQAATKKTAKSKYVRMQKLHKREGWDKDSQKFAGCPIVEIKL